MQQNQNFRKIYKFLMNVKNLELYYLGLPSIEGWTQLMPMIWRCGADRTAKKTGKYLKSLPKIGQTLIKIN